MGSRGALLVTAAGSQRIDSVKVTPRDTTGAGDAFIGSFAAHYAEHRSTDDALRQAVRYAADLITREGTQSSYASRAEFEAFVSRIEAQNVA